ncbi:porin family protein [uncultured Flavobacterium sp.]|uniref:porin family protein n=1 Tax=uncultured Flavobacterium sp. TaxID=165435 RepID=UPI0030EEE39F|tara:strand:+ start:267298 stop:267909 length:612 start_codon:yes stop_codon:yes gene_type:complete
MKKIILLTFLLFGLNNTNAQDLSYGALLGFNAYDVQIDGPISANSGFSGLNFGGFLEYQLNNNFGVKGNLLYSSVVEDNFITGSTSTFDGKLIDELKVNSLQIHGLLKYDVNSEYNKGFYLIGGFRMTNVLSAKADGEETEGFYKKSNFGAMLGFGVNFAHHFGLELLPEINLTNTLDSETNKTRNFGGYINFTINLESIINK